MRNIKLTFGEFFIKDENMNEKVEFPPENAKRISIKGKPTIEVTLKSNEKENEKDI